MRKARRYPRAGRRQSNIAHQLPRGGGMARTSGSVPTWTPALQSTPSISRTDRACSLRSIEADWRSASTKRFGLSSSTIWTSNIAASNFFASRVARRIARSERAEKSVATSIFSRTVLEFTFQNHEGPTESPSWPSPSTSRRRSRRRLAMTGVIPRSSNVSVKTLAFPPTRSPLAS